MMDPIICLSPKEKKLFKVYIKIVKKFPSNEINYIEFSHQLFLI